MILLYNNHKQERERREREVEKKREGKREEREGERGREGQKINNELN